VKTEKKYDVDLAWELSSNWSLARNK